MKKTFLISICILITLLTGCLFTIDKSYSFQQELDQIQSIEIVSHSVDAYEPHIPVEVEAVLSKEEFEPLVNAITSTEGNYVLEGVGPSFGKYMFRITYYDGGVELISEFNTGYITPDGEFYQDHYFFEREAFNEILSQYLSINQNGARGTPQS